MVISPGSIREEQVVPFIPFSVTMIAGLLPLLH
jgi:hypothetical protein